jgi:GH15 family glucan-1,4-alpha-glucosidase
MHQARVAGQSPNERAWDIQRAILKFLETAWKKPDEGIWEVRGGCRHFTHSKIMAWVAFERAVCAVEKFGLQGPVDCWRANARALHEEICTRGFNPKIGAFTQEYGGKRLDASLLMAPLVGFLPISDPRVQGTLHAIEERLLEDGFVNRYSDIGSERIDGLPPGEAAFLPCTFWLADNYVLSGRMDEAREVFDRLLAVRNDLGLLAEEYDPKTRRQLGNFPQAFSHVGLINTAHNLCNGHGPARERAKASPRA